MMSLLAESGLPIALETVAFFAFLAWVVWLDRDKEKS